MSPDTILPIPLHINDYQWLGKVSLTAEIGGSVNVTCSAHQAALEKGRDFKVRISSLLPLFVIELTLWLAYAIYESWTSRCYCC